MTDSTLIKSKSRWLDSDSALGGGGGLTGNLLRRPDVAGENPYSFIFKQTQSVSLLLQKDYIFDYILGLALNTSKGKSHIQVTPCKRCPIKEGGLY